jgi:hypothetical protein
MKPNYSYSAIFDKTNQKYKGKQALAAIQKVKQFGPGVALSAENE